MTDIETDINTDFELMAERRLLHSLACSTRRYSVHEVHSDFFQVLDDRRLLEGLRAWPDLPDSDGRDMIEELRGKQSTGPTLNLADQVELYMLMIYASDRASDVEDDAIRLGRLCRDAVVFESDPGCVVRFLRDVLRAQGEDDGGLY